VVCTYPLYSGTLSFFFSSRRRHTRFSRDWSSDVCSSDLSCCAAAHPRTERLGGMVLRPQLRRLPPLARRDAQIQELRREIRRLERRLEARQRQVDRLRAAPPPPPPYPPRKPS